MKKAKSTRKPTADRPTFDEIMEESRREYQATQLRILRLLREKIGPIAEDMRALAPAANASPMGAHTRTWALRLGGQMGRLHGIFSMVDAGEETRYRDLDEEELRLAALMGSVVGLLESFRFGPVPDDCGSKLRELADELEARFGRLCESETPVRDGARPEGLDAGEPQSRGLRRKYPATFKKEANERIAAVLIAKKGPEVTCRELAELMECDPSTITRLDAWKNRGVLSHPEPPRGFKRSRDDDSLDIEAESP